MVPVHNNFRTTSSYRYQCHRLQLYQPENILYLLSKLDLTHLQPPPCTSDSHGNQHHTTFRLLHRVFYFVEPCSHQISYEVAPVDSRLTISG